MLGRMSGFDPDAASTEDSGVFGLDVSEADAAVVLLPVPFEATTSYRGGTSKGPAAILEASRQVDLTDLETGRPWAAGIHMRAIPEQIQALSDEAQAAAAPIIACGGDIAGDPQMQAALRAVDEAGAAVNQTVYVQARDLIAAGKVVGLVGGDHASPFGAIRAHAEAYGPLGILHLDAHADLRVAYEGFTWSHASIMERVLAEVPGVERLVQVGLRDLGSRELEAIEADPRIEAFFDPGLAEARLQGRLLDVFDEAVAHLPDNVYCSFDIDGLDPALCPNTGTPVPGGLAFAEASFLLRAVVRSGRRIVGFDLCEVAPGADEWDGNVGARLLYKLIGWTLKSQAASS